MLRNYDAEAVAEVMGIAFLEDPDSRPARAARPAAGGGSSKAATASHANRFVIDVNHYPVRVVDAKETRSSDPSDKSHRATPKHGSIRGLTMRPASPALIEKAVENGLPRLVLRRVAERLAGADKARIAALEWGIVPKTTLERREEQLSPLESERTERVARLFVHARRALGSDAEAREFMTAPHPQLDGRTPIDAAKTDLGARRTEQILNSLEYGLAL